MNLYRSLGTVLHDDSFLKILELLAEEGYLQNIRQFLCYLTSAITLNFSRSSRFVELICSMTNLQTLDIVGRELTPDVVARVFQSCSKLTNLHIWIHNCKTLEMDEHLKNQLRSGFQRLRRLYLEYPHNGTWPAIQEMLT